MTQVSVEEVYAEVKRMRTQLKSLEKNLDNLAAMLIPEEKATPEEMKELKALKKEAQQGECVSMEDVLKKHGAKKTCLNTA